MGMHRGMIGYAMDMRRPMLRVSMRPIQNGFIVTYEEARKKEVPKRVNIGEGLGEIGEVVPGEMTMRLFPRRVEVFCKDEVEVGKAVSEAIKHLKALRQEWLDEIEDSSDDFYLRG